MSRFSTRVILAGGIALLAACSDTSSTSPETQMVPTAATNANVLSITSLSVSPSTIAPQAVGASVTLTLIGHNDKGQTYTLRNVVWSTSNATVASLSSNVATAKAGGTATISTGVWGMTASVAFPVKTLTVKKVVVSLASSSIAVGTTTQATATLTDSLGAVLTGQPVSWVSSNPAVATVSSTGLVTAVAGGTSTISATSGGVAGSAVETVTTTTTALPPATGPEVFATLPQTYLNTTMPVAPATGGVIISVPAGGSLQTALNNAKPGDVIELANGATFTGNFLLPNKNTTSTSWIVIRPQSMTGVPAAGARMTPALAANARLPIIVSPNNVGAFQTAPGSHHYRIIGLEITVPASIANTGLVRMGDDGGNGQTTVASIPHDLVLDRLYIHGTATGVLRRCIALNSASTAIIDSYVSDCHDTGSDAQAIAGWNGPGPYKIVNNYLEGSGENIIFGGTDPGVANLVPSDMEIRRNHITKKTSWKGVWLVKNLVELKNAQRVLIEGNILENNWQDGQGGSAVVLKTVNQSGSCTWCVTGDVTIRGNLIRNVGSGFNIGGSPDNSYADIHARRLTITDNIMLGINASTTFNGDGRGVNFAGDPSYVTFVHNTIIDPTSVAASYGPLGSSMTGISIRDNMIGGGAYGVKGDSRAGGTSTLDTYMPGGTFAGNVVSLTSATGYPAGNFYPTSSSAMGFTNLSGGNVSLASTSPYKGKATDGRDPGADYNAVMSLTSGVIVP